MSNTAKKIAKEAAKTTQAPTIGDIVQASQAGIFNKLYNSQFPAEKRRTLRGMVKAVNEELDQVEEEKRALINELKPGADGIGQGEEHYAEAMRRMDEYYALPSKVKIEPLFSEADLGARSDLSLAEEDLLERLGLVAAGK